MPNQLLIFVFPAITLILAAAFLALWWQNKRQKHVLAYSFGFASMAAGVVLNVVLLGVIGTLGILTYHIMSMAGLIAIMWATAVRVGLRIPLVAYSATVLATAVLLALTSMAGDRNAMVIAQNINSALLLALTAQNLWHAGSRNLADRAIIWSFCGFAVFGFARPFLTIFAEDVFGPGADGAAMLTAFHVFVLAVLMVLLGLSLAASVVSDNQKEDAEQAGLDPLTGLPARGAFEKSAVQLFERSATERVPISLIVGDIDLFKRINDTFGHRAGDSVIREFGGLLSSGVRPGDLAGRVGGEEFCIIAWNCDEEGACALADRLRVLFANMPHKDLPAGEAVTASFGVAEFRGGSSYAGTFERADTSLYEAKRGGRDRVVGEVIGEVSKRLDQHDDGNKWDDKVVPLPRSLSMGQR